MNRPPFIIDTDVHDDLKGPADLFPYLEKYWIEVIKLSGLPVPFHGYRSPVGVKRYDATPPDGGIPGSDPAHLISHYLDANGIDIAILTGGILIGASLFPDRHFANAAISAYNEHLADHWLSLSDRFRGSIYINHSDPEHAAKEITRKAVDKRFVQVMMPSASRMLLGQKFYHPIYRAAENHGLPVAFHPGVESAGVSGPPTPSGYPSSYFEWHNIIPTNFMAQINSLVCEGVFELFPKLRIVGVEGGIGWLPTLMWRMDKNWKALRASTPWLKRAPSEYIIEHVRLTTQPIEEPEKSLHLLQMLEMAHAEQTVMFSSDYPHWDNDSPMHAMPKLPQALMERIYYKNAAELYGIEVPVLNEAAVADV